MKTDYSLHAAYWDWDGFDDSEVYRFWYEMGSAYGSKVFSPMCAIGQTAAYMARQGACVTALDLEKEMIAEGKKRFGHIPGLGFVCGDVCTCDLGEKFDFAFLASTDLHLLPDLHAVKVALQNINRHLRPGGGLGLEVWFAPDMSFASPMRRFEPRAPRRDGLYIWKEGDGHYDAARKIHRIHQVVHVGENVQFDHDVTLQLYDREELFALFRACGFEIRNAWCDMQKNTSENPDQNVYLELVKKEQIS
ncbi:MAG: class I SAM-dependent methyltransferase [Clostridiales bacterium]|nr:class I SAM-dependent methyltransferase [Clostridiales bacterium]